MMAKKQPKRVGAVLTVPKHQYVADGGRDHRGQDRCDHCGLGRGHAVHQLEPVAPDVAETTERIVGERP